MTKHPPDRVLRNAAFVLVFFAAASHGQPAKEPDRPLAIVGGLIYTNPTGAPIRDGVILIKDGKIAAVGPRRAALPRGTRIMDAAGLTITAGFWNSHVHFMERKWAGAGTIPVPELTKQLEEMLTRYGFTSVFDMWSPWENTRRLRERIESGEVPGPGIRTTGEALVPKGGVPPQLVADILGFTGYSVPEVEDEAEASAAAGRLLDRGVDGIKMYARTFSPPIASLSERAMKAAVEEAHRRGKPAFVHPTNQEGLLSAVRAGVDVIVHTTPQSGPWEEPVLAAMKQRNIALIPTLRLWRYELRHDRASVRERFVENGVGQLRAWFAAGGTVLFGTDAGYMGEYDPREEYELMAKAGMDFRHILASLTTVPAARFTGLKSAGRIEVGLAADLVVLHQDPSRDVQAFAGVHSTIRDGNVIYQFSKRLPAHGR